MSLRWLVTYLYLCAHVSFSQLLQPLKNTAIPETTEGRQANAITPAAAAGLQSQHDEACLSAVVEYKKKKSSNSPVSLVVVHCTVVLTGSCCCVPQKV